MANPWPDCVRPLRPMVRRSGYRVSKHGNLTGFEIATPDAYRLFEVLVEVQKPVLVAVLSWSATEARCKRGVVRDVPVFLSHLIDSEERIVGDGRIEVIVGSWQAGEVRIDDHKELVVYTLRPERVLAELRRAGLKEVPDLELVRDGTHEHFESEYHDDNWKTLCDRFGCRIAYTVKAG